MKGMRRTNTNEEGLGSHTFTIIVDDEVAAYFEQAGITNANAYMNELLYAEKERLTRLGKDPMTPGGQELDALLSSTPDTSGYPEMQEHFRGGTSVST
jgi:hypothetical protein